MSEFIYILENSAMPGIVKIGRTERTVSERVGELSSQTAVPVRFTVFKEYVVSDSAEAERTIHRSLAEYRVSESREFFRLEPEHAAAIIDDVLAPAAHGAIRDFEREDELLARATQIAIRSNTPLLPGMLAGPLKVSYDEAEFLIHGLKARGVLDEHFELTSLYSPERNLWLRHEQERQQLAREREEWRRQQAVEVRRLLRDLRDPETFEPVEVRFVKVGEELQVLIRGTAWATSEAQKRLASFQNPPEPQKAEQP